MVKVCAEYNTCVSLVLQEFLKCKTTNLFSCCPDNCLPDEELKHSFSFLCCHPEDRRSVPLKVPILLAPSLGQIPCPLKNDIPKRKVFPVETFQIAGSWNVPKPPG